MHLAHQHPHRLPALITALGRTATEPAALDTGRGPRRLTDQQLDVRLAHLEAQLATSGADDSSHAAVGDHGDNLLEYVDLHREANARHRDRLAAVSYEPPAWIIDAIGERPAEPNRRYVWDRIVDRVLRYRTSHNISDNIVLLLGPKPPSVDIEQRTVWIAANRAVERGQRTLSASTTHCMEPMAH